MGNFTFKLKHDLATLISAFSAGRTSGLSRVLMFHSVGKTPDKKNIYHNTVDELVMCLDVLNELKIPIVKFGEKRCGVSITFDDGFLNNWEVAAPVLIERKTPFTVFMISDFVAPEKNQYMNREHLLELSASEFSTIGAHGKTHRPLATLSLEEAREEMRISKYELENIIGKEVSTMSFPHGSFTDLLVSTAQELGYKKCGNSLALPNVLSEDNILLNRYCIFSCESRLSFKQKVQGKWDWIQKAP